MNFAWLVKNPVKVCMLFLALILMGLLSVQRLPLNLFPDIQTPRITVVVYTDGLTADGDTNVDSVDTATIVTGADGTANITVTSFTLGDTLTIQVNGDTDSLANPTAGGGNDNTASGWCATIGGGQLNLASGENATVSGGHQNTASGNRHANASQCPRAAHRVAVKRNASSGKS